MRKKLKKEKLFEEMTNCLWIEAEATKENKVSLDEETTDTEVESIEVMNSLMIEVEPPTRCVACLKEEKQTHSRRDDNQQCY